MNGDGHQLAHRPDRQEDVSQLSAGNSVLLKGLISTAVFDVFCRGLTSNTRRCWWIAAMGR
jgi:hypothetical protein